MSLRIVPLTLEQANSLVARLHRHHKPVVGHRFSIGVTDGDKDGQLVGAAIVGRPKAKSFDQYNVCEVTRLVTDGTKNACSILYAAAARVAREMGFSRIQSYILESEPGTSLKASGWVLDGVSPGGQWNHTGQSQLLLEAYAQGKVLGNRVDQPTEAKQRWIKKLA